MTAMKPQQPTKLTDSELLSLVDRVEKWEYVPKSRSDPERFTGRLGDIEIIISNTVQRRSAEPDNDNYKLILNYKAIELGRIYEKHYEVLEVGMPPYHGQLKDRYEKICKIWQAQLTREEEQQHMKGLTTAQALLTGNSKLRG
ncbi:hypothetical protein J4211_05835 [Candidatus Woesearchaeota archaeon]|nr:hypothetical protein [Candidatus Woesearchaeota archaeon]